MANTNYIRSKCLKPFKSWKNKYFKSVTKKETQKFDLFNKTVLEISEYTQETPDIVKQKYKMGPESEKNYEIFLNQTSLMKDEVEQFYQKCDYFIYELPLWNAECNRPRHLAMITLPYVKKNKYSKVMDFGGGAGDLCIELQTQGLDATYCDISEKLFSFSEWRFKHRNLSVKMVQAINKLDEIYDCIFSFDAFEHIKDLPVVLNTLTSHIRPGGSDYKKSERLIA